jgi:hypothetical protein
MLFSFNFLISKIIIWKNKKLTMNAEDVHSAKLNEHIELES